MEITTISHKKSIRNTNIEILRLILMFFICLWHIIVHGFNLKHIGQPTFDYEGSLTLLTFCSSLFSPAVYCFMFISGWYGINFSIKKYCHFIFLGICCYFCSITIRYYWSGEVSLREIITHVFPIASGRWWFFSDYIKVYLIAPFIDKGFIYIEKKTIYTIVCFMTFLEVGSFTNLVPCYGLSFFGLLYIYIIARFIKLNNIKFSTFQISTIYAVSFLIVWGSCNYFARCDGGKAQLSFIVLDYNNPFIILMAISLFLLINKIRPTSHKWANKILSNLLAVYLLTEGIDSVLYAYEAQLFKKTLFGGLLFVLLTIITSLIVGYIISSLFNVIYKSINNHFKHKYKIYY